MYRGCFRYMRFSITFLREIERIIDLVLQKSNRITCYELTLRRLFAMEAVFKKQTNGSRLLVVLCVFVMSLLAFTNVGEAKELEIKGADASQAHVVDMDGNDVTGRDDLSKYSYYTVVYNWSLEGNQMVKAGDVVKFTLPKNTEVRIADLSLDVYNDRHRVVGHFEIEKGKREGTLTFNHYFERHRETDIRGSLVLKVSGTAENKKSEWFLNKSGWLDMDKQPNWTVVYNPQGRKLTDVVINDFLFDGQTFDRNSMEVWFGHVDSNNQFVAEEKVKDPIAKGLVHVSKNDDVAAIQFDKLDCAVQVVYRAYANTMPENFVLRNVVDAQSKELGSASITSTIEVGGGATAQGIRVPVCPPTITLPVPNPCNPCGSDHVFVNDNEVK